MSDEEKTALPTESRGVRLNPRECFDAAIASVRMEGLTASPSDRAILDRVARGESTYAKAEAEIIAGIAANTARNAPSRISVRPCPPNKLGIHDPRELAQKEAALTELAIARLLLGETPLPLGHSVDRLTAIHRALFATIYDYGGTLRTTALAKQLYEGSRERTHFTPPAELRRQLQALFDGVREANGCKGLGRLDFAERGAAFLADMNAIHPFVEGNGRTQRTYLQLLALDAGHVLLMDAITQERMIEASIRAGQGDLEPLRDMLHEQLDPTRREALRGAHQWLDAVGYDELNQRVLATTTPGLRYQGTLVSMPKGEGEHFVMMDGRKSIFVGNIVDLQQPGARSGDRLNFAAGRTPLQELDHYCNLAEREASTTTHVEALSAAIAKRPALGLDSGREQACIAARLTEAAARDQAQLDN